MATELLTCYAAQWPDEVRRAITPEDLVAALTPTAHAHLTSVRPALLAYTLSLLDSGGPGTLLGVALGAVRSKLQSESARDTVRALASLRLVERKVLRAVAAGKYTCAELEAIATSGGFVHFKEGAVGVQPEKLAALIICLRESGAGDEPVRLQPPYSDQLLSWLTPSGNLAVCMDDGQIDLALDVRKNLVFIAQERAAVDAGLRAKVSHAVLKSLASNGAGVSQADGALKAPETAAEFDAIPALSSLRDILSAESQKGDREPSLAELVRRAAAADPAGASTVSAVAVPSPAHGRGGPELPQAAPHKPKRPKKTSGQAVAPTATLPSFADEMGWELLLAFRHFESHIWGDAERLVNNGLTAAVIAQALRAAMDCLTASTGGCFLRRRWTLLNSTQLCGTT